jgi:hypothetical protein
MASTDSTRPLPPLTPPPARAPLASYSQIDIATLEGRRASSDYPRTASGFAPPDARPESESAATDAFRPGSFAPETAIDEQIADLERWAEANLGRDRKDKLRFWLLRGLAFIGASATVATAGLGLTKATVPFGVLAAVCIAIDSAWASDSFRNVHRRAVYDLRELQNTLKLRWDKVRLAHPDPAAPQRTAHALALLDQVQHKREEIGRYLGSAEASPGIRR